MDVFSWRLPGKWLESYGIFTLASRYCAMSSGEYKITGNSGAEDEQCSCISTTVPSVMPGLITPENGSLENLRQLPG